MNTKSISTLLGNIALTLCLSFHTFLTPAEAMKPVWNESGWLLLDAEHDQSRMNTAYWAVVGGVETWFLKYKDTIRGYCFYNSHDDYWAWLPTYGYTHVTARKLAELIWRDSDLGLTSFSEEPINQLIDIIEHALREDRGIATFYKTYAKPENYRWDPYSDWKWRSKYMEQRYADNGDDVKLNANCWGTASYLTRSYEWAYAYPNEKYKARNYTDEEHRSFPYIFLEGWLNPPEPGCVHCFDGKFSFDDDLSNNANSLYLLKGTGDRSSTPRGLINSFDIIRVFDPDGEEFYKIRRMGCLFDPTSCDSNASHEDYVLNWPDGQQLGLNMHSAVYLMTSDDGKSWFYEKGNFGPAVDDKQYGIRAFGEDPLWYYEQFSRSYFQHDETHKRNLADGYELDWAGVEWRPWASSASTP